MLNDCISLHSSAYEFMQRSYDLKLQRGQRSMRLAKLRPDDLRVEQTYPFVLGCILRCSSNRANARDSSSDVYH